MTLFSGQRLGPYEITAKLGEGGMGEVYQAKDFQLGRDVALKVLPAAFTQDPERLVRFEREARLLAQLNHPNIAQIYGFEASGETRALVMELVEGPTLADRLEQGAFPLTESLSVALQITLALEEAHEKGIVHRDLKPQNVKTSIEGKTKVLDFGLAKALDPAGAFPDAGAPSPSQLAQSPTLTLGGTAMGVILGTAAYMAPEQAKGFAVDKKADIWAFGVVLYEMLTGISPFVGDSVPDTLARVLQREVDFAVLPAATPPAIRRLLRRCLTRSPKNRLHDIADARIVLEETSSGADREGEATSALPTAPPAASASRRLAAVAAAGIFGLALGLLARGSGRGDAPATAGEPQHLALQLAASQELGGANNSSFVFSPDGGSLYFTALEDGRQMLYRRDLDSREAKPIPGTENADACFVSPDGRWIGFSAGGRLWKVPVEGGRPYPLGEARGAGGSTWLADGNLVFAPIYSDGLFRMSSEGGAAERLTTPDRANGELGHWWPSPLPGERKILFTGFRTPVDRSRIGVLDLDTGEVAWLIEGGFFARYVATGHLVWAKGRRLYAAPFDAVEARLTGPSVMVLDDVHVSDVGGWAQYAVSSRGMLAYGFAPIVNPPRELIWLDRQGRPNPALADRRRFLSVSLSPDGGHAALTVLDDSRDLWIYSFGRETLSRLTTDEGTEFNAIWSHDARELIFVVDRPPFEFHRLAIGTPDSGRPLWQETPELDVSSPNLSPDGRTIAYALTEEQTGNNLYTRPLDGSAPPRPIRATRADENYPSFSPDGRWITYTSDETGRSEIYAEPYLGPGERVQVSPDGGHEPVWAGNGEIFYRRYDEMRVVATRLAGGLATEPPRTLFRFPIVASSAHETRTYDVARDGSRILVISTPAELRPRQIDVVTHWTAELAHRVPGGKP